MGLETLLRNLEYCGTHHGGRWRGGRAARERDTEYVPQCFSTFLFDFEVEEQRRVRRVSENSQLNSSVVCSLLLSGKSCFIQGCYLFFSCCSSWIYHHRLETDLRHVNRVNQSNYNTVFYLSPITSTFRSWNVEKAKQFFHHNSKPTLPEIHRSCR